MCIDWTEAAYEALDDHALEDGCPADTLTECVGVGETLYYCGFCGVELAV